MQKILANAIWAKRCMSLYNMAESSVANFFCLKTDSRAKSFKFSKTKFGF